MNSPFNWGRILAIALKEVRHILRDPFTLAMALGLPVLITIVFGYTIEFNMKNINAAVFDHDKSSATLEIQHIFASSGYFKLHSFEDPLSAVRSLSQDQNKATLVFEPGFESKLLSGSEAHLQVLIDGADNSAAGSILGYFNGISAMILDRIVKAPKPRLKIEPRYLFNPELNSKYFVVPGLTVVVTAIISILLTSLTIAREWENGSMELLLSTPVRPFEIVLGKLLPYTVLCSGAMILIYLAARIVFGVPFSGSHLAYALCAFLFLSACLAQGLLISVLLRKQQLSMQFAMLSGLLPSILLSGFIFPVEHMPPFFRVITSALPPRWFVKASRDIYLKGADLFQIRTSLLALFLINLVLIFAASKRFKRDVEP